MSKRITTIEFARRVARTQRIKRLFGQRPMIYAWIHRELPDGKANPEHCLRALSLFGLPKDYGA